MDEILRYNRQNFNGFAQEIAARSSQNIMACYQCRKCAAGCPVAETTGITPDQLIRSIILNDRKKALENRLVWQCVSCYICGTRCPNNIQVARVTETLKKIALEEKLKPRQYRVKYFHESFCNTIRYLGRINEVGFMGLYEVKNSLRYLKKMRFRDFIWENISQMFLGMRMFKKKRVHFGVDKIKDAGGDLKRIYARAEEKRKQI